MRWLICPGLPRGGTTWLHRCLSLPANAAHFLVPAGKEVHWLERGSPDRLDATFGAPRPGAWYVDLSPGYSMAGSNFLARADALPRDGITKFIVTLRHPVAQAYSHYLHDLKGHVSAGDFPTMAYPLIGAAATAKYLCDRSAMFGGLRDRFGADNVLFLNFHTMFDDAAATGARIAAFLGLPKVATVGDVFNEGGWLPRFVHGGDDGAMVEHDNRILAVPAHALALINGPLSRVRRNVPTDQVLAALSGAATWQARINPKLMRHLETRVFARAIDGYSSLLGEDLSRWRTPRLAAAQPPLPDRLVRELGSERPLGDVLGPAPLA